MTWVILLAFVGLIAFMSLVGRQQVAWSGKMRRVKSGVSRDAEWMAPDDVVSRVQSDYLTAMQWLPESVLRSWSEQWNDANLYFSGRCLERHLAILKRYRLSQSARFEGVMRCHHHLSVRHFSDDGERCLVIDHQTGRRIQTVNVKSGVIVSAQDLGAATVVYEMRYDKTMRRWKIDQFTQELPLGWTASGQGQSRHGRVRLLKSLPPVIGRDN